MSGQRHCAIVIKQFHVKLKKKEISGCIAENNYDNVDRAIKRLDFSIFMLDVSCVKAAGDLVL